MTQTILITGASSGIGRETAKLFQARGWNVVATMRTPEKESELRDLERVLVTKLDVTAPETITAAIQAGIAEFGDIDVVLNNAAFGVYGPLEATPSDVIRRQYETNVFGVLEVCKAIAPYFRKKRAGTIINVSSIGGLITFPLGTLYHGTKFALEGMSEALSFEMRECGVAVKIVEPGDTLTDFKVEVINDERMTEYQPLVGRLFDCYAPIKAQGSKPRVIAEVIYEAATDGADQLRYPAGHDAVAKSAARKSEPEAANLANMRTQFKIA